MEHPIEWAEYVHFNERDIEVPWVRRAIAAEASHNKELSVLDVGAHYSGHYYAKQLRPLVKIYTGIDLLEPDEETKNILDKYVVGNVRDTEVDSADVVLCISSLEHCGITTYKTENYVQEQLAVFSNLILLANKVAMATFPYGKEALFPGQYANIHEGLLFAFEEMCRMSGLVPTTRFFYNKFPQGKELWYEIERKEASQVPMDPTKGIQCVCTLSAWR